jgi:hypothetical protein
VRRTRCHGRLIAIHPSERWQKNGQRFVSSPAIRPSRLAHFFGTSAEFRLHLQSIYEIRLVRKRRKINPRLPTLKRSIENAFYACNRPLQTQAAYPAPAPGTDPANALAGKTAAFRPARIGVPLRAKKEPAGPPAGSSRTRAASLPAASQPAHSGANRRCSACTHAPNAEMAFPAIHHFSSVSSTPGLPVRALKALEAA